MDAEHFDRLARALHSQPSRRLALRLLASGTVAAMAVSLGLTEGTATHFGCRHVGEGCRRKRQCCSGRCRDKRCKGHDAGICTTQNVCTTGSTQCGTHTGGANCFCFQTTGEAPFCGRFGACRACTRDRQCEAEFGSGAACVVHDCVCGATGGTGCVRKCADPD